MAYVYSKYPKWCWSQTREDVFEACLRKYYYRYYLAHNGWESGADPRRKRAYRLKKLNSITAVFGSCIHDLADEMISGEMLELEHYLEVLRRRLNGAVSTSLRYRKQWERYPSRYMMLQEIYYQGKIPENLVEKIQGDMEACIYNLMHSSSLNEVHKAGRIASRNKGSFTALGTEMYAEPDLTYWKRTTNTPVIVDWKSGRKRPDSDRRQLETYCFYFYTLHPDYRGKLIGRLEYLKPGDEREYRFAKQDLGRITGRIRESMGRMQSMLSDPDLNRPRPEEDFPKTAGDRYCMYCNFRELCGMQENEKTER